MDLVQVNGISNCCILVPLVICLLCSGTTATLLTYSALVHTYTCMYGQYMHVTVCECAPPTFVQTPWWGTEQHYHR